MNFCDAGLLQILNAPYDADLGDQTLRPSVWHLLDDHISAPWADVCRRLRDRARSIVVDRADLRQRCRSAAELLLTDSADAAARLASRRDAPNTGAEATERRIGQVLADGIVTPAIEVDAAGIVLLSSQTMPTERDR